MYDRFKVTNEFGVETWYAYVEAPVEFLDTPIPLSALIEVYGMTEIEDGSEFPNVIEKTLRDFTLSSQVSLDGTKALIALGAREWDVARRNPVNADDLAQWEEYLTPYGFDSTTWLTLEEAITLRNSDAYTGETDG